MDKAELELVLSHADYARHINAMQGVLIGYAHDGTYPDHKNLEWLREHLTNFFYIDRIIIDTRARGQGLGQKLYEDIADFAKQHGHSHLACEVNTVPDNPASHRFHLAFGFTPLADRDFPGDTKSVRYYAKKI
jgi:predicted GNAT superfamily acetyltransferase